MRRTPKYWIGFYLSIIGSLFIWEIGQDVFNGSILFRGVLSNYRLYLGIIFLVIGFLLHNSGLKPRT